MERNNTPGEIARLQAMEKETLVIGDDPEVMLLCRMIMGEARKHMSKLDADEMLSAMLRDCIRVSDEAISRATEQDEQA